MKDKIFGVLQRVGRSFMLPIAILPVAGLLLGFGGSFTNETMLETYHLIGLMGPGTVFHAIFEVMSEAGNIVFANLPIIFAMGVAIGMAKKEKEVAALAAAISFFVMHASISAMINLNGGADKMLSGATTDVCGITSLQMGVFGGILVGLGVAALHNKYYKIQLPQVLSFFGGTRFVPIISALVYTGVGIVMFFVWPVIQSGIYAVGNLVLNSGYAGTWVYGFMERLLIPFGLHHVFYLPFWQTGLGGTMEVGGKVIQGAQNIFFAQLADPSTTKFAVSATRFMSGKFPLMIFGLPGAALAMYKCAKPEKKKQAGSLLLSATLACMFTGITEPLEFSFLFVAPALFAVQVVLAGSAYMIAHILNIAVGLTFSGGLLDFFLFGILQGNEKTSWMLVIPVGIVYFLLYYFIFSFLIKKFDFKTPGREDDDTETKLYTKADVNARKAAKDGQTSDDKAAVDELSQTISRGLGGKANISDVDCCATRLRITVIDPEKVNDALLKSTGASGVVHKEQGVQIIYGPRVTVIKSDLEDYLSSVTEEHFEDDAAENNTAGADEAKNENAASDKAQESDVKAEKEAGDVKEPTSTVIISSPMTGIAADLSTAPDEAFASKMMGDGAVVTPEEGVVVAPEDGTVLFVFDTKHALGFTTDSGIGMIIHVGIDTVKLEGKGFDVQVEAGCHVNKGDVLMKLDLDYLKANAPSVTTPVICTELKDNQKIRLITDGPIKAGEPLYAVDTYEK